MRNGMTLMSVMVAVALAGIVSLAIARLLGNQSKTMSVVRLREQREELLKHYKNIVISGWDATRAGTGCAGEICARNNDIIIPTANGGALYLAGSLYDYNYTGGTADRWWKVSVDKNALSSGEILQADNYVKAEGLIAVKVKVEFIRKEHPVVNTRLARREEIVFLHHNTSGALATNSTQCSGSHLTQQYEGHLSYRGPLYVGKGAITQYDFTSNYTKCSQVPLVDHKDCGQGALLGFFRDRHIDNPSRDDLRTLLISGSAICSTSDFNDHIAQIRGSNSSQRGVDGTEKRTVGAIDCDGSGYVEWMADDEEPKCVEGAAPRGVDERVAGESKLAPFEEQPFRLAVHASDPDNCTIYNNTSTATSAFYTVGTCQVKRHEGIEEFNERGEIEVGSYVKYYDNFAEIGPPGPQGPCGPEGDWDAPQGPRGQSYCPGCCETCVYTCTDRWEDIRGNWHCREITCTTRPTCGTTCPRDQSC